MKNLSKKLLVLANVLLVALLVVGCDSIDDDFSSSDDAFFSEDFSSDDDFSGGGGGAFSSQGQCQTDDPETVYWTDRSSGHVASQLAAFCALASFDHCLLVEFANDLPEDAQSALRQQRDASRETADQLVQISGSGFDCAQAPDSVTCDDVFYTSSGLTCWGASANARATSPPAAIN